MLQYKPQRWWFDFVLIYNKIIFVLLTVLLDSDSQAWNLLVALTALAVVTLVLVVIDKPFRDPDLPDADDVLTLADKLMVLSQVLQLQNYGVAAACLYDEQHRIRQYGQRGTSESVAFAAAVCGFGLVAVQLLSILFAYCKKKHDKQDAEKQVGYDNPLGASEDPVAG